MREATAHDPLLINDLKRHRASIMSQLEPAMRRVVESGWFILGQEGAQFETAFARYCDVEFCIGVANGTDAIEIGLRALGVKEGDYTATVANAGFYVSAALAHIGARPVYVDVDPVSHLMDLDHLRSVLEAGNITAVIVTHLYGLLHDMSAVMPLAAKVGAAVFEDCAQSHGARTVERAAGSFGHAASFSFYPTKNLGAFGDGGAIVTSDAETAERCRRLRQYGWEAKYRVGDRYGRNSRLDEIQAAILLEKLPRLDEWNARRRHIAERYSTGISHPKVRCPPVYGSDYVAHLFVVTCENRDGLREHLAQSGISTDVHYPVPDYRQRAVADLQTWPVLPVTEKLSQMVLTLPCFPEMTEAEIHRVIDGVNSW